MCLGCKRFGYCDSVPTISEIFSDAYLPTLHQLCVCIFAHKPVYSVDVYIFLFTIVF